MVALGLCLLCGEGEVLGLGKVMSTHCHGKGDRPAPKGVLGGFQCSCPCRYKPHQLYAMATAKYPNDREASDRYYVELMKQAGFLVPRRTE